MNTEPARARIHVRMGTVILPARNLRDTDVAHDIIDVPIGENEQVEQIDLEPITGAGLVPFDKSAGVDYTGKTKRFRYRCISVEVIASVEHADSPALASGDEDDKVIDALEAGHAWQCPDHGPHGLDHRCCVLAVRI